MPVCAADAARLEAGEEPDSRQVTVGGERMPYYQAPGYYGGYYAGGMFGGFGGFLPGILFGSMIGGGWGGGDSFGGSDGGGFGGGDFGGGDFGGGDFGGTRDSGGVNDSGPLLRPSRLAPPWRTATSALPVLTSAAAQAVAHRAPTARCRAASATCPDRPTPRPGR